RSTRTCRRESGCVTSHEPQSVAPGTLVPRGHPYQASQGWVGHHLSTARSGWGELDAIALIERGSFWCSCMKNAILESSWVRLRVGQGRFYNGTMTRALVYSDILCGYRGNEELSCKTLLSKIIGSNWQERLPQDSSKMVWCLAWGQVQQRVM